MTQFITKVPNVVSRTFGEEVIIANYKSGLYYSLLGSAAQIWFGMDAGHDADSIATAYASQSDASADAVRAFIDEMVREQLVLPTDQKLELRPWQPGNGPFEPPAIERFDDLKDLLLLDPVHEVSEEGWPHRKEP